MKKKVIAWLVVTCGPLFIVFGFIGLIIFMTVDSQQINNETGCNITGSYDTGKVDKFLEKAGVFAGKREVFERVSAKYHVDPVLMIAICIQETGWGKSDAVVNYNNPSGQMTSEGLIHFGSLEEGLELTGKTLNNLVNERGLSTVEKLQTAYAPSGALNDPTGLNNFWVININNFIEQLGGLSSGVSSCENPSQLPTVNPTQVGVILMEIPNEYKDKLPYPPYNKVNYNTSGSYPVGQCTWYAYNRIRQLVGQMDDYMGNGGQWGISGTMKGYPVTSYPRLGSAVSFPAGIANADPTYGHVAFVEYVHSDGSILVSESNVVNDQTISYRIIDSQTAKLLKYVGSVKK